MSSCLGIYVDKNLIKYAKLKKEKDTYKVLAYNVDVFENLEDALNKVIVETNSFKDPITINISNEIYNYFDVFSELDKKDITKSLDIEFEMLCQDKGYDKRLLESRYLLMENKENYDKFRALYFSTNRKEIDEKVRILSNNKLSTITSVLTSITNLIDANEKENFAIVNIENEIRITTVTNGEISRVDILNSGLEKAIDQINKAELSWRKAYNVCKNITIYNEDVKSLDSDENEYIEVIMPAIEKIGKEIKKIIKSFKEDIGKIYITGMGATINNIDLYFNDLLDIKCEILKPFFIDTTSLKNPIKDYIEVNSAIALALDGLGFLNKDLNFAPVSRFESIDNLINAKENFDVSKWKDIFDKPLDIQEKLLCRLIAVFLIGIICYSIMGSAIYKNISKQKSDANKKMAQTMEEIKHLDNELMQVNSFTSTYAKLIDSVSNTGSDTTREDRTIPKDAIPNMLNKLMFIIPQKVQVTSIKNTEGKHIVIVAVSEKYEQLGYFSAAIKTEGLLENVQSTSGEKSDSLVQVTIEGDLP